MDNPVPKERYMKFPYTLTSKVYFFPYKQYYKHAWFTKYWLVGLACTIPLYWYIGRAVNSPDNVARWREIRRKMYAGEEH